MRIVAMLLVALALVAPASALAAGSSSTCQAYNPQTGCNIGIPKKIPDGPGSGSLPFTGLDVVLLVVGGGALVGTGFVVRRLSRRLN
jgi:hypothetical protein